MAEMKSSERPGVDSLEGETARLITATKNGDGEAWTALYHRFAPQLLEAARKGAADDGTEKPLNLSPEDAEEAVSDVFFKAFEKLSTFRETSDFYTWLHRMLFNRMIDVSDEKAAEQLPDASTLPDEVTTPESALFRKTNAEFANALLDRLQPQAASLLRLREFDGLSYKEMGDNLGISETEAMTKYKAARKRFEELAYDEKDKFEA